jgi:hypothetical protein
MPQDKFVFCGKQLKSYSLTGRMMPIPDPDIASYDAIWRRAADGHLQACLRNEATCGDTWTVSSGQYFCRSCAVKNGLIW